MPGYVIIETLKLIRSPIKKTRLWAQHKATEAIKNFRAKRKESRAGLSGEDAWMYFGEQVVRHDLIPIFDENLKGLATMADLTVPSSELAIHQRAAGFHIQAFAWDKPRNIAYAVYQPSDRAFGYISGGTHEVLPTSLTSIVERTFGKDYTMKSEAMRGIHGGEYSRGVEGDPRQTGIAIPTIAVKIPTIPIAIAGAAAGIASGITTAVVSDAITERRKERHHEAGAADVAKYYHDKWEAFEKKLKEKLPWEQRKHGLQELSDADLGPLYDHIIMHINEYRTLEDVPKPLLILAKRYVRMHQDLLKNMPLERVHQQYGAIMGEIIELEMKRGFATGLALCPKPVGSYRDPRPLGVEELVFRSRPYRDIQDMPPELVAQIRSFVRSHPQEVRSMNDREMVMRYGWAFYHAAQPEIAAIQGPCALAGGNDRPSPMYQQFVRDNATNKLVERYRTAQRENWSRDVSAGFEPSEVREAVGDFIYLNEGTAFAIQDLNRRELENALDGLNVPLDAR